MVIPEYYESDEVRTGLSFFSASGGPDTDPADATELPQ